MQTTIRQSISHSYDRPVSHGNLWNRFMGWTNKQEENRFGWSAAILMGHGCVFTVITVMAILFTGNHFIFWPFAIGAMAACLVVILSAMPTRIIIPVFFLSLLVDLVIIIICLTYGFDLGATYV